MTTLVSVDTKNGDMQRYVKMADCEIARAHHGIVVACAFQWTVVEEFRRTPPVSCALKPPQIIKAGGYRPPNGCAA